MKSECTHTLVPIVAAVTSLKGYHITSYHGTIVVSQTKDNNLSIAYCFSFVVWFCGMGNTSLEYTLYQPVDEGQARAQSGPGTSLYPERRVRRYYLLHPLQDGFFSRDFSVMAETL